jgi:hypothetical protein
MSQPGTKFEGRVDKSFTSSKATLRGRSRGKPTNVTVAATSEDIEEEKLETISPNNKHACNYCYENRRKVYLCACSD